MVRKIPLIFFTAEQADSKTKEKKMSNLTIFDIEKDFSDFEDIDDAVCECMCASGDCEIELLEEFLKYLKYERDEEYVILHNVFEPKDGGLFLINKKGKYERCDYDGEGLSELVDDILNNLDDFDPHFNRYQIMSIPAFEKLYRVTIEGNIEGNKGLKKPTKKPTKKSKKK